MHTKYIKMKDLKKYNVLCYDYGSYIEVADRLSRDFGKVYYFCPTVYNGYPTHAPMDIGINIPGVEKVSEWASVIDMVDLVYFPDSHEPYLQNYFRSIGKLVFGAVFACRLEHDRLFLKQTLKELGLPVNNYSVANGIDSLDEILKNSNGVRYIKSSLRGDSETWKHEDYRLSKMELSRMKFEMGLYGKKETYIVEHPIESIGEIGVDTFCIDGEYPEISLAGIEVKDAGYVGRIVHYKRLPNQLQSVCGAFGHHFKDMGYRGHYSNEVIISKDKRGFLIDNTCRCPQPPTSLSIELYSNYSEIVWDVSNGKMPKVGFEHQWGVQLIIKSDVAQNQPSPILVPDEYRKYVKVKNLTIDEEGTWYYTPFGIEMKEIGSVIGMGNSMDEAIKQAIEVAEAIKGFDIYIKTDSLDQAKESISNLRKEGVSFI